MKVFILIVVLAGVGCSARKSPLETALEHAVSFEAQPNRIRNAFAEFPGKPQSEAVDYLLSELGSNNLSSFMLTCPLDKNKGFEFGFEFDPIKVSRRCRVQGKSLVEFTDLSNISSIVVSGVIKGRFDFNVNEVSLIGVCEFEAVTTTEGVAVQRLAIPSKDRTDTNSLVVFEQKTKLQEPEIEWRSSKFFEEVDPNSL